MESAFTTIVQELESQGYYLTQDEQETLWNYIMAYGEIRDSLRQVFAVLGEVAPTLTDVRSKGWIAREIAVSPFFERDVALIKIEPPSTCARAGESVTFTASVNGGNTPITYKWYLNDVEVSNTTSNNWIFSPASEGTYKIYVIAVDADGCTAQSQAVTLTVTPALGFGSTWIISIILVAVVLAVAALILAQKRRIKQVLPQ